MRLKPAMLMNTTMTTSTTPAFARAGETGASPAIAGLRNAACAKPFDYPGFAVAFAGRAAQQRGVDRRDIELVEIRPAEHHARGQLHGHVDDPLDLAGRLERHD